MANKILYTTSFPDVWGGGQIGLLLFLERLEREKFVPLLVVPAEGEVAERARAIGCDVRVFPLPRLRTGPAILPVILRFRRLLKTERVSLIHTDDPRSTLYALLARTGLGIPLFWHIRDEQRDPLDPILEAGVDRLILVAGALGSRFSSRARARAVVIHNGVSLEDGGPADLASLPPRGSPLVICPARLDSGQREDKGQSLLLRAMRKLVGEFPSLAVWFIGAGPPGAQEKLAKQAEETGLGRAVHVLGFRRDLRALLPLADLVVLPSFHEAFPRVLLEAMAAGRAIVATRVGGVPEAVEDGVTGLLVPPGDVSALAEAMAFLLRDPGRRRAMEAAARLRVQQFTLDTTVKLTESLYREYLDDDKPRLP